MVRPNLGQQVGGVAAALRLRSGRPEQGRGAEALTKKQQKVLEAIVRFCETENRPPATRELAAALRCHVKIVYQYILALERKGYVARRKGHIRVASELLGRSGIPVLGAVAAGVPIVAVENRQGVLSLRELFGERDVPVTERTRPNPYLVDVPERDVTTTSGTHLTMMNPAYMTRLAHELMLKQSGARGHITSLTPIRPANAPDPWETEALRAFERGRQIQRAYELLDHEFQVVADVQVSLLPAHVPEIPGFEGATHYRPATRAGGDYFDFFPLPDAQWGVVIADVSGHGAPAAVVMAMTRVILHTSTRMCPPEQVLADVNAALCKNILSGQFVTCCYGVLDPHTRKFTFASAGHPAPLVCDPESGRARPCAGESGFPLGVDASAEYTASSCTLAPGSVLVLYTDGITEAFSPEHEQFGEERLRRAAETHPAAGAGAVRDGILAALNGHRGSGTRTDIVTPSAAARDCVVLRCRLHCTHR